MFKDTDTLNPVTGCDHSCDYCYARDMMQKLVERAKPGHKYYMATFAPTFHEATVKTPMPGRNGRYFVSSMGDLFGEWVPPSWIHRVLEWCGAADESNTFMFLTKNPERYLELEQQSIGILTRKNFLWGATVETDLHEIARSKSAAPGVLRRLEAMKELKNTVRDGEIRTFICIEPVMKFSTAKEFAALIAETSPELVYLGYDNHDTGLDEPSKEEFKELYLELEKHAIQVDIKTSRGVF